MQTSLGGRISSSGGPAAIGRVVRPWGSVPGSRLAGAVLLAAAAAASTLAPRPVARPAPGPSATGEGLERPARGAGAGGGEAPRFRPEELLPPDTVALVSISDARAFLEALARTGMARALDDPELRQFLALVGEHLPSDLASLRDIGVALLAGLRPALAGGLALALVRVDVPARAVDAVLVADVSGREPAARAFLASLEMLGAASGCERSELALGGSRATVLRLPVRTPASRAEPEPRGSAKDLAAWALDGDMLVVATSRIALEEVLSRRAATPVAGLSPSLADAEDFALASARAALEGGRAHYSAFVNVRRAFEDLLGPAAHFWRSRLGLEGLEALALAGRLEGSVREGVFLRARARSPSLSLLVGPETGLLGASLLPERTLAAVFGQADGGMVARLLETFARRGVVPFGEETARRLAGLAAASGLSSETLSRLVSGEFCLALWSAGRVGWFPRVGLAAETASPEALEPVLVSAWQGLASVLGGRFQELVLGEGGSAVRMRLVDAAAVRYPFLGSPAWAVARPAGGGRAFLVASGDALAAKELACPGGARLESNPRWKALLERLPARRSGLVYVDLPTIVERGFEPYAPAVLARLVPGASVWLRPGSVPPGSVVARHLEACGGSSRAEGDGVRLDAATPAGLALTLGTCAVVAGAFLP